MDTLLRWFSLDVSIQVYRFTTKGSFKHFFLHLPIQPFLGSKLMQMQFFCKSCGTRIYQNYSLCASHLSTETPANHSCNFWKCSLLCSRKNWIEKWRLLGSKVLTILWCGKRCFFHVKKMQHGLKKKPLGAITVWQTSDIQGGWTKWWDLGCDEKDCRQYIPGLYGGRANGLAAVSVKFISRPVVFINGRGGLERRGEGGAVDAVFGMSCGWAAGQPGCGRSNKSAGYR